MHQLPLNFKKPQEEKTPLEIIASWNNTIDANKVQDVKIEEGMITYTYEGAMCMCENRPYEVCKERALYANMIEIQHEIDQTLRA